MSEDENFLARWSRRKREAEQNKAEPPVSADADTTPRKPEDEQAEVVGSATEATQDAAQRPAIDLSKLPPIDSITATTDIRPFLAAGIPEELRSAALRRAWVADPAIRDFVGIAENQWDFTVPGGAPGFGPLLPVDNVRRLVAEVLGDHADAVPPETSVPSPQPAAVTAESAHPSARDDAATLPRDMTASDDGAAPDAVARRSEAEEDVIVPHDSNHAALQNNEDDREQNKSAGRRAHGSALPE